MSKGEMMDVIRNLSEDDRLFLAAFLKHLTRADSPAYKTDLAARIDEFSQGKTFSLDQLTRLNDRLQEEGL